MAPAGCDSATKATTRNSRDLPTGPSSCGRDEPGSHGLRSWVPRASTNLGFDCSSASACLLGSPTRVDSRVSYRTSFRASSEDTGNLTKPVAIGSCRPFGFVQYVSRETR